MRPSWRSARAWWIFALLLSATWAFGQGSKLNSEFEPVQERDQDNPKAREALALARTAPLVRELGRASYFVAASPGSGIWPSKFMRMAVVM